VCRISEKWITGGGPESPVHSLPASSENKRASNNPLDERESTDFRSRFRSLRPSMKLLRSNQGTRYSSRGHRAIQLASGLHHASGSRLPLPAGGTFFVVLSFYGRVQRAISDNHPTLQHLLRQSAPIAPVGPRVLRAVLGQSVQVSHCSKPQT
jgi:hypothetical protein